MSKAAERQKFIRYWQDETGESEIDLNKVAELALKMGWQAPPPVSPIERLAKQFKLAAKQDIRRSGKTGRSYRGYHAVQKSSADGQLSFFYIDIDDPKTTPQNFKKSCVMRREGTIDDLLALHDDQTHWNKSRPEDQNVPILPHDLGPDIEWRLASEEDDKKP